MENREQLELKIAMAKRELEAATLRADRAIARQTRAQAAYADKVKELKDRNA